MSLLQDTFARLAKLQKKAFIPFIVAGDPSLEQTLALAHKLVASGADILEFGVPFSDPMADGKIIQDAHKRALLAKTSLLDVLDLVAKFRLDNHTTPVILMGYANPIEALGYSKFATYAKKCGVSGVIVVDIPPEESQLLKDNLAAQNIDLIFLIAPTTNDERLLKLAKQASGFAYFVSLKGVTGSANLDIKSIKTNLNKIRSFINIPIAVGFGVKSAADAKEVATIADAVVIGSSLVALIADNIDDNDKMLVAVADLAIKINDAL